LGKIEAIRHKVRKQAEQWGAGRFTPLPGKGTLAVVSRLIGALFRAFLVLVLVATPSILLPGTTDDTRQVSVLIGVFLGVFVFVEYAATYPSLVEFRHAPPFNRVRFISVFITVFLLSVVVRDQMDPTTLTRLVAALGAIVGQSMDFDYSPVRLVALAFATGEDSLSYDFVRTAAGVSYLVSLMSLVVFTFMLRGENWPSREVGFNFWINLPTFDPTSGGDVVKRLERDGRVNIILGLVLPFLVPAVVDAAVGGFGVSPSDNPQLVIWIVSAWSFLPASLFMRGIAMGRIADMIRHKRARAEKQESEGLSPAFSGF